MKIAIISDIHGNLEALSSVIIDIKSNNIDKVICLGDVVGYGPNPNECIDVVKAECEYCLIGNHEAAVFDTFVAREFNDLAKSAIEWTRENLSDKSVDYIKSLSMTKTDDDLTLAHSTPYEPYLWYYISSIEDAIFNFSFFSTKFCLIGHTHVPGVIAMRETDSSISVLQPMNFNYKKDFNEDTRFIVNVGSVGQPRDKNPKACYVIIDTDEKTVSFQRVPYDIVLYQKKMRIVGMPEFLTQRVAEGI